MSVHEPNANSFVFVFYVLSPKSIRDRFQYCQKIPGRIHIEQDYDLQEWFKKMAAKDVGARWSFSNTEILWWHPDRWGRRPEMHAQSNNSLSLS